MKQAVLAMAVILSATAFAYSAEPRDSEKDWCLPGVAEKCTATTAIDIVVKAKRLEIAVNKGSAVYTPCRVEAPPGNAR